MKKYKSIYWFPEQETLEVFMEDFKGHDIFKMFPAGDGFLIILTK